MRCVVEETCWHPKRWTCIVVAGGQCMWAISDANQRWLRPVCLCHTTSFYNGTRWWLAVSFPCYCCANGTEPRTVQCSLNGIACSSIKTPQIGVFMLPNSIRCSPSQCACLLEAGCKRLPVPPTANTILVFACSAWCSDKCAPLCRVDKGITDTLFATDTISVIVAIRHIRAQFTGVSRGLFGDCYRSKEQNQWSQFAFTKATSLSIGSFLLTLFASASDHHHFYCSSFVLLFLYNG